MKPKDSRSNNASSGADTDPLAAALDQIFAELEVLAEFKETVDFISPLQRLFREILG